MHVRQRPSGSVTRRSRQASQPELQPYDAFRRWLPSGVNLPRRGEPPLSLIADSKMSVFRPCLGSASSSLSSEGVGGPISAAMRSRGECSRAMTGRSQIDVRPRLVPHLLESDQRRGCRGHTHGLQNGFLLPSAKSHYAPDLMIVPVHKGAQATTALNDQPPCLSWAVSRMASLLSRQYQHPRPKVP
jgi:hypothetical protein